MEITDGLHEVFFTADEPRSSGTVLIRAGSAKLVLLSMRSQEEPLRLVTWVELDPRLFQPSPDDSLWKYEYTGHVDFSKVERIPQRGTFPDPS